jgi:Na+/melibiose symporter-like transporter
LDELVNGERREGLLTAAISFVYKMEVSLCVLVVGYMISWTHYSPALSVQPAEVITRLQWFAFLPNIICSLLAFYFASKFSITEADASNTIAALVARRSSASTN